MRAVRHAMRQAATPSTPTAAISRTSPVRSAQASGTAQLSRTGQNRSPNSTYATGGSSTTNSGTSSAVSKNTPATAKRRRACGYASKQHTTTMAHSSAETCALANVVNGSNSKHSATRMISSMTRSMAPV